MLIHMREATPLPPVTYGLQGQKLSLINLINQSSRHDFFSVLLATAALELICCG